MRTLLSWFRATLSLALRSDVFLEQTLKEEEGGREEDGIRILGKEHFTYFIQVTCCSHLGILLSASVHPRMAPFLINQTRTMSYSSPQLPAYKKPPYSSSLLLHLPAPREG